MKKGEKKVEQQKNFLARLISLFSSLSLSLSFPLSLSSSLSLSLTFPRSFYFPLSL